MGVFSILLALFLFILTLMDYYNDYFDWWYVTVMLILYAPLFVTVLLFMMWMAAKDEE